MGNEDDLTAQSTALSPAAAGKSREDVWRAIVVPSKIGRPYGCVHVVEKGDQRIAGIHHHLHDGDGDPDLTPHPAAVAVADALNAFYEVVRQQARRRAPKLSTIPSLNPETIREGEMDEAAAVMETTQGIVDDLYADLRQRMVAREVYPLDKEVQAEIHARWMVIVHGHLARIALNHPPRPSPEDSRG